ncbi:hypothetical protein KR038_008004 [Drosophila bunnanda]|nr:hypothetical protein KR038_008004 [Drosophila bunnanda]
MSSESNGGSGAGAGAGGGGAPQAAPPQYIITTPSEVDADEFGSLGELQLELGSPETQMMQSQKFASSSTTKVATRSYSMTSSSSTGLSAMQQLQQQQMQHQQIQQQQQQQQQHVTQQQIKQTQQIQQSQKIISSSTRSQSLQSSSILGGEVTLSGGNQLLASASAALAQQLKAQSSTSIITSSSSSEQRTSTSTSSTRYMASSSSVPPVGNNNSAGSSSSTSATAPAPAGAAGAGAAAPGGKSRFQSFLQQPEGAHGFLTAHQKHVRQFVRSTSAHSEAAAGVPGSSRPEKCIRSASTQIDDAAVEAGSLQDSSSTGGSMNLSMSKLGLQQSSSILISKSAETIEMKSSSAGMRTQLTLSGGFLAPPGNRKITILSPIHAPPGLHEMLRRAQGRSPLSPRISFPGSDTDLFG